MASPISSSSRSKEATSYAQPYSPNLVEGRFPELRALCVPGRRRVARGGTGKRIDQEPRSEGTGPRVNFSCWTDKDAEEPAWEGTMSAKKSEGFTAEERAAMRERAKEQKAEARAQKNRAEGERAVLAKIAEMQGPDRAM